MAKKQAKERVYNPDFSYNKKSHYSEYESSRQAYFGDNPTDEIVKEYNKTAKKPKKLAKWIVNTMVILSLAVFVTVTATLATVLAGGVSGDYVKKGQENVHNFVGLDVPPVLAGTQLLDIEGIESNVKKAAYLYGVAAQNTSDAPYFTAYDSGTLFMRMGGSDNYMDIDKVLMKSQTEYFCIEYHLKNSVPILDSFIGAAVAKSTDIVTTERMYYSVGDEYMTYQKVKNNEYDENGIPTASWDATIAINTPTVQNRPVPYFNAEQDQPFRITNHTVTEETISMADVDYNEEGGYYVVSLLLDPTNPKTVVNSQDDIRAGTGDKSASYTYLSVVFTVWNTGYFRTFSILERWSAKVVISLEFDLETNWVCSYNKSDCNFNKYPDAKSMKNFLGK